jgi:hypothetical protein
MAGGGVEVRNLPKVVRGLQAIGLDVEDLKDAFGTIASEAAEAIAEEAPQRTGRLSADVRGNRAKGKAVVRAGRASVPYAGPINYGWEARNIEPALFMQAGEQKYVPTAVRRLEEEINAAIRRRGLNR